MIAVDLHSRIYLVSGATAGIGLVTALELARQGATVVGVGRSPERNALALARIQRETGNPHVEYLQADLSSLAEVRRLAAEFRQKYSQLHGLVNNAGAFFSRRLETVDGLEMTFALNHLSPFLLTNLLLDALRASAPARIVNVSSGAHFGGKIDFDDLQSTRRYSGWAAYSRSKLANILFTYALAQRLAGSGVTVNALHPGFVGSNFGMNNGALYSWAMKLLRPLAISPEKGASTSLYLAASPEVATVTGQYFSNLRPVPSAKASYDVTQQERLWAASAKLVHIQD